MFELFRSQSRSAAGAIVYVTIGTLMVIWSGLRYYYFILPAQSPPAWQSYACVSTIFSGIAIAVIGLLFGAIGRGAKEADNTVGMATTNIPTPVVQPVAVVPQAGSSRILQTSASVDAPLIGRPVESVVQ